MGPIRVTELDHIVLNVGDIDRSVKFYTEVLGLQAERLDEFRAGKVGFPSVRINDDTIIDLFPTRGVGDFNKEKEKREGNLNHFCMVVGREDFSGIVDYLAQHGIPVREGPVSRWGARGRATSVYFLDPDGNEVEIRCY
ncbi:MAG TPA: VOC family protein [Candidatus Binatia bacterium]|jgi:catechol 2,3-dioxygenase-like lactoylglutathione lyase family enzyme